MPNNKINRRDFIAKLSAGSAAIALTSGMFSSCTNKQKPNIVLIMTDDVGFEHWSCYDGFKNWSNYGGSVPTPNIDKLAKQGMMFTNAYAVSAACTPSRYSIMTGQFPGRSEHDEFTSENPKSSPYNIKWNTHITENNLTLHKVLSKGGYYTGFVGKFHIGGLEFDKSEKHGFVKIQEDIDPDSNEADRLLSNYQKLISKEIQRLTGADFVGSALWENSEELPVKAVRKHNLEWITKGGVEFLESIPKDKPFFLNFNTTTLHGPHLYENVFEDARFTPEGRMKDPFKYHPSRKTILKRLDSLNIKHGEKVEDHINHYNAGILYMDDQIGALMKKLEDLNLTDNTIVILTADHNTEPAKSTVYNKGVHVPFLLKWPEKVKSGSTCSDLISFVDFLPTFAEIGNVKLENDAQIDGFSFAPILKSKKNISRKFLYFEEGYTRAVSNGDFKLISMRFPKNVINDLITGKHDVITHLGSEVFAHAYISQEYYPGYFDADQLYDLKNDPYEQLNLANNPKYSEQFNLLQEELQKYLNKFDYPFDLSDTDYATLPEYIKATQKVKSRGSDFIWWWNRKLDYPPQN